MLHLPRTPFIATIGVLLMSTAALSSVGDELLIRATSLFRGKDYAESITMARKSAESPHRYLLLGVANLRLGKAEEAIPLLATAEQRLPLLGDYAALYRAEALLKLKRYAEAATVVATIPKSYPTSPLIRRSEKLQADIQVESGDYRGGLKTCLTFIEKYPSGADSIDMLYQSARCRAQTGDPGGAALIYRGIWLDNPTLPLAAKSRELLGELEKKGIKVAAYTPEELLRRASSQYTQSDYTASLLTLQSIPSSGLPAAVSSRIDLRAGMAYYRLRNYKAAEKSLTQAATAGSAGIVSEGRFWQAKALERQDQNDRAYTIYMELAGKGKKGECADDALTEAAGLRRNQGRYSEAARLFEQLGTTFPDSKHLPRAAWDAAWCRYLAGEFPAATDAFRRLMKDETLREKALYWLARAQEKSGNTDAGSSYRLLLDEYPAGFYAAWHREQKGLKDLREPLGRRNALSELPLLPGYERARLLASLGLLDEARSELTVARKRSGDKKGLFPGLGRIYLEMEDYGSAIALFQQNRPVKWDKASLALWTVGFPLAYTGIVSQQTRENALSEALVYALIRAESGFSASIKSHAGAIGLMQLMPATARQTARDKGSFNPLRLTTPEYNIKLGTRHLRDLLKSHEGDVVYSIAAYNAGAAAVERWRKNAKGLQKDEFIESIPYQETRDYVKKVYTSAATYRQLYGLQ